MVDHLTRRDFLAAMAGAGIAVPIWLRLDLPTSGVIALNT